MITYDDNRSFTAFVDRLTDRELRPDFLSVYTYPYSKAQEEQGVSAISTNENYLLNEIASLKAILARHGFSQQRLYITEWNMSVSSRNYLHDSTHKGAYIVKNLIDCTDQVSVLAYWGSTDLLDEYYDSTDIIYGGSGLIGKSGIRKPAFYAFQFMSRLGKRLLARGNNYIITANKHNSYTIVCHNFVKPGADYYRRYGEDVPPDKVADLFEDRRLQLSFRIDNVLGGRYSVKKYFINKDAGSALDEWLRIGQLDALDKDELEYLSQMSTPRQCSVICRDRDCALEVSSTLSSNEFQLLQITRLPD